MRVNRRQFLQQLGGVLAALGIGEAGWFALSDRCQQVLAQPTSRKLALLIGINQYPEAVCDFVSPKGSALNGCLTDVELQRELLQHRFGFQTADILTLTDQQATRSAIVEAFQSHLIDQARSGDVIVFHFSGLGSRVLLGEDQIEQQSLVPIDGILPTAESPIVNDLMLDKLRLLLRSLPTDQVIAILDTGFSNLGRITQGSLRVRSRPSAPSGQFAAQQILQNGLGAGAAQGRAAIPGILLAGAGTDQVATEAQWSGFYAGRFTYALTQQLWCSTPAPTLDMFLRQAANPTKAIGRAKQRRLAAMLDSGFATPASIGAEGFVRSIDEEGRAFLWLGGLPATVLENMGASLFAVLPDHADLPSPLLQIRSREGLLAKAKRSGDLSEAIQVGQPVQEIIRHLPRNLPLTVGLDPRLERVERVDATSAFAAIPQVSAVIAGEQSADLLFGKTQSESATLTAALPPAESSDANPPIASKRGYGLFSLDRSAIYSSPNQDEAAVKTAIHRMTPQLRALLANKLLRLLENHGSSRLGVRATLLTTAPEAKIVAQQETLRAPWTAPQSDSSAKITPALQVAIGSQIQYQLLNYSDSPLYWLAIGLDAEGLPIVYPPRRATSADADAHSIGRIEPGAIETLLQSDAETLVEAPIGRVETHLICSRAPFVQAVDLLYSKLRISSTQRLSNAANALDLVQALLQDLQQPDSPTDAYLLDVNQWAAFRFAYDVVT